MTAEISYRARTSPAHALAVAERLADKYKQDALYRNLEGGAIEVATMRKGALTRHVIDDRGTTLSVETFPRNWKYSWGIVVTLAAIACLFVLTSWLPWVVVVISAFALFAAGGWLHQAGKLQARLGDGEWKFIPMLGGWEPRTREQLDAIETLLDDNENRVFVRPHDTRSIEVVGMKGSRFNWYRVDEDGETTLLEAAGRKFAPYASMDPLRRQLRKRGLDSAEWIAVARHLVLDDGD
jgi:hypothetical protein